MNYVQSYDDYSRLEGSEIAKMMEYLEPVMDKLDEALDPKNFQKAVDKLKSIDLALPKEWVNETDLSILASDNVSESSRNFYRSLALNKNQTLTFLYENKEPHPTVLKLIREQAELQAKEVPNFWENLGNFGKTVKDLFLALTEGGSPIGILHLVLDVIGFVDWIGPIPVGMIADIINGIIYAIRGKWMLALISFAAAFFLDVLKGIKFLKAGKAVLNTVQNLIARMFKGSTDDAAKAGANLVATATKQGNVVLNKIVDILLKNLHILGSKLIEYSTKIGHALTKFAKDYPLLERMLLKVRDFFNTWAAPQLKKIGDNMTSFRNGMLKAPADTRKLAKSNVTGKEAIKSAKKAAPKGLEKAYKSFQKETLNLLADGAKVTRKGDQILIQLGNKTKRVRAENATRLFNHMFKGSDDLLEISKRAPENIYRAFAKNDKIMADASNLFVRTLQRMGKLGDKGGKTWAAWFRRMILLTSKYIYNNAYNNLHGKIDIETLENLAQTQATYIVTDALLKDKMEEHRKKEGEYAPEYDPFDKEIMQAHTDYINTHLKLVGESPVVNKLYQEYAKDEAEKEVFREMLPQALLDQLSEED